MTADYRDNLVLTSEEQRLLDSIDEEETVEFLQALLRTPSAYPPGDCRDVIQVVARKLEEEGVRVHIHAKEQLHPSLLAFSSHAAAKTALTYHAHIDTVLPGDGWTQEPYGGTRVDDLIYGRGAGDDKGSVAAQVMAMVTIKRSGASLARPLQLAVVAHEEAGGELGTRWLHEQGLLRTEALIVGEQTNNHLAIAERVACGIDLIVHGRSAHGAMPWAGENAILKAARALTMLEDELLPRLQARAKPPLPPATLNIGRIEGGSQWNIVPDACRVAMDRRLLPGETRPAAIAEIRQVLNAYAARDPSFQYELISTGEIAPNINTPPDHPFTQAASRTLAAVAGEERPLTGYLQTSDGRWLARDGIPILIFGPSDPVVAHAPDEHIAVSALMEAARFLTLFSWRWLGGSF